MSICVAVWKEHSEPNLRTLTKSIGRALAGLRAELIVVLNGIARESAGLPSNAIAIDLGQNRGVPVAWNRAADIARGGLLCFVNDDVVLADSALRVLASALGTHTEAGVVGPVGTRWDIPKARHLSTLQLGGLRRGEVEECDVVSGFLFAARSEVFHSVGGFDEAYSPCGWEETDFCTAVRLRLGLRCYAVAGVGFEHEFGISTLPLRRRIHFDGRSESLRSIAKRNRRHFRAKWARLAAVEAS